MSKADSLAAKAAKLKKRQDTELLTSVSPESTEQAQPPAQSARPRARSVRLTIDVTPNDHTALTQWCAEIAQEIDVTRVAGQELMRVLLRRALADPVLREHVTREIAATRAA